MHLQKVRRLFSIRSTENLIDRLLWLLAVVVILMGFLRSGSFPS